MKAVIYCRVSTKEQAEKGFSLDNQKERCSDFALQNCYEVDKLFIERGESAKTIDRTQLQKLIKYVLNNKDKITALIVWKFDRLARNLGDQIELFNNFGKYGVRILSVTENNEDTAVGKLTRNVFGSFAQYENDLKSERTLSGMKKAVSEGRWMWKPPVGYKMDKDAFNKPILAFSDDSKYIKMAFELFEKGIYKQTEIVDRLASHGLKNMTATKLNKILRNPCYAGLIISNFFPGETIVGLHKPIIERDRFYAIQEMLEGNKSFIAPQQYNHPDFPLRGFIRCPKCNRKLTGSKSTGRRGKKYPYYHCRTKGCSLNIKKLELEKSFYLFLKEFEPKKEIWNLFEKIIEDVWKTKQADIIKDKLRLENDIKKTEQKKSKLVDLLLNETVDKNAYRLKMEEIEGYLVAKNIELNETRIELGDISTCINFCKHVLTNITDLWLNADLELKQRLQSLLFPGEVYYRDGRVGTVVTAKIIRHLRKRKCLKSNLVAPRGFEPLPQA